MIKEFALEPDALATWENFRYFIEKFGVPQGRLIAEFPGKWRRMVLEAARSAARPKEFLRIVERLNQIGDEVLLARGRPGGDGTRPWLERALVEHARLPFDGIIACTNPNSFPQVLLQSEVGDHDFRFKVRRQIEVERSASQLVACADFLLCHTAIVKWVDYMIDLRQQRWQRPFRIALDVLKAQGRPVVFEIHRQFGNEIEKGNLREQFRRVFEHHRANDLSFALYLHPEKYMHDRFVLSERGGIFVGHGLDDNEDGGHTPTANVLLLEHDMYLAQWRKFSQEASLALMLVP